MRESYKLSFQNTIKDKYFLPKKLLAYCRECLLPILLLALIASTYLLIWGADPGFVPFLMFPIVFAASKSGLRSGIVLTGLSTVLLVFIFDPAALYANHYWQAISFVMIGVAISFLGEVSQKANRNIKEVFKLQNKRKDDFLAMLGHELRNPLSGISTASRLLTHPKLGVQSITDCSKIIHRQVAHMNHLINDLLDVSRVTQGSITIKNEIVDLVQVVSASLEQVQEIIRHREHQLDLNLPTSPIFVQGDKVRLVQIVTNLLTNAARYTKHSGNLKITLSTSTFESTAQICIQDNGIGIAPMDLEHVFDIFMQVNRSSGAEKGGLGLGLALVKSMVEAHAGKVSVRSDGLGCGSTFCVTLPWDSSQKELIKSQTKQESNAIKKILLVDDNRDAAQPLAMLLELEGYHVEVAYDGLGALELAKQTQFDVGLFDIGLPDMDGYALAHNFKAITKQSKARLVALTGFGTAQDIARASQSGFDRHLVKPVNLDMLFKELCGLEN